MKKHYKFYIEWIGFPITHRKVKGVYLINDFYIGASKHIRSRILNHLQLSLSKPTSKVHICIKKAYLENQKLTVSYLDENPFNEKYYIENYKNLVNCKTQGKTYNQMYKNEI